MPDRERQSDRERHQHRRGFRAAFTSRRPDPESARARTPDTPHRVWTPEQVRALGMTTDLTTAAAVIGIGRTLAYDLARTGDFPVRILRLGGRVVVPVADLLRYLGEPTGQDDGS